MNYLITGGTGFLGSYIAKLLIEQGDTPVLFSRSTPSANSMSDVLTSEQIGKVRFARGDVKDLARLVHVCQDESIDIIIHPAALLQADCDENPVQAIQTNIVGTQNVFEAARICSIKRVVWASSNSSVGNPFELLGNDARPVPNDAPHNPMSLYGKIKDFDEYLGDYYSKRFDMEIIALRYVVIYGKGRRRGNANYIKNMLNDPALGKATKVRNGEDAPNFIYVEDAARAAILASVAPYVRGAYNIVGECISMPDLRDYVLELLPDAQIELLPGKEGIAWDFDTSVEREELGYVPEVGIKEGALITINDVRLENGLDPIG